MDFITCDNALFTHRGPSQDPEEQGVDGPRDGSREWSKSVTGQISYDSAYMWNLKKKKKGTHELIYKAEIESQMEKTNIVTEEEGKG